MDFTHYTIPSVTMLVSGLLVLLYLVMSLRIVFFRFEKKMSLGFPIDSKDPMFKADRIHANFSEYVPLIIIMMALLEITGTPTNYIKISGFSLIVARIIHWIGIMQRKVPNPFRFLGAAITFGVLGYFSIALVIKGLS